MLNVMFAWAAWATLCVFGAVAAPLRVAVIAGDGERAPKAGMAELLTVELSKLDDVVVLDREEIRRVLAEQKLSATGLVERATSMRMGALLRADAFVALERLGQDRDQPYRIKVVETRTGLVAGDWFCDAALLEQTPATAAADFRRSLAWLRTPDGQRRYVAVLGYAVERRGRDLTDLPTALGALVEHRLGLATNVLVVDREYLRRLQDEKSLTGGDQQVAASSYLVEGQIRPAKLSTDQIEVQTLVHALRTSAELPALQLRGSPRNLIVIARDAADGVLRQIDGQPIATNVVTAAPEAAWFVRYAQPLLNCGETTRALPALESAYVLDPTPDTARRLAIAIQRLALERVGITCDYSEWGASGRAGSQRDAGSAIEISESEKRELLASLTRALRLWQVYMDGRIASDHDTKKTALQRTLYVPHALGGLWGRLRSADSETAALYRELVAQKEACRRQELAYVREHWPKSRYVGRNRMPASTGYYENFIAKEVGEARDMSNTASEFTAQMRELMTPWFELPGYMSPSVYWRLFERISQSGLRHRLPPRFLDAEGQRALLDWCDWVSNQPSLHFHMAGLYFRILVCCSFDTAKCAAPAAELVSLYPQFLRQYGYIPAQTSFLMISLSDPGRGIDTQSLHPRILDAVVTCLDRSSFVAWFNENYRRQYSYILRGLGQDYERRWLDAAAARLPPAHLARYRNDLYQAAIDSAREEIERRRFELHHGGAAPAESVSPYWQAYRVEPTKIGKPLQPGEQLALCKRDGDTLALVWTLGDGKSGRQTVRAEVIDLGGRTIAAFPAFVRESVATNEAPVELCDVAGDTTRVYVAAGRGGLLVFDRAHARLAGEANGLPRASLVAVAAVRDRAIMGFDADYLCAFDPVAFRTEEIAYSRSLLKRNPLDGSQQHFAVRSLVSDPTRGCVWMATAEPQAVWRLSWPGNGPAKVGDRSIDHLSLDDGMILGAWQGSLSRLDPAREQWSTVPLYGNTVYLSRLHVILGNDTISAGVSLSTGGGVTDGGGTFHYSGQGGLYLHENDAKEAFHLALKTDDKPATVEFLVKTSATTALAATKSGAWWRLTKSNAAPPENRAVAQQTRERDTFVAAQTNRVSAANVTASSTTPPGNNRTFDATNLIDGNVSTCWAAATNETTGVWVECAFERPVRLSCLQIINGWVPDRKNLTPYPNNHRAKTLSITTDQGERAAVDVADHNDPQFLRLTLDQPVQRLRMVVEEIYESEVNDPEDPPWLNISEIAFFGPAP